MLYVCPHWLVCASNANGLLGGLGVMWNPNIYELRAYTLFVGIILSGYKLGSSKRLRIINSYAPYTRRKQYWD